jgi:cytochrome P450
MPLSSTTLPPGPRGVPGLGVLLQVRRDPTTFFENCAHEFGETVFLKIGQHRAFLITNPRDIRHVLQDNARNYHKSPLYDGMRRTLGNGLLTSEDGFWLRQRRIAQPAFHRERLVQLAAVMSETAAAAADKWRVLAHANAAVDIAEEMMQITRSVVLRTLLGADLGQFSDRVDSAWHAVNEHLGTHFWSPPFVDRLPTPRTRRFLAARRLLREAVEHVIRERRKQPTDQPDLLSMLLSARDAETGEQMTDEQLRVEVTTFLLAGQETTSLALAWTWYLLSRHQAVEAELHTEVDRVLGGRRPEYADLARLPYSRTVISESMRLFPPAWAFSRQALGDDELGGYRLRRGWLVLVVPYVLHRLAAFWDEPERFDPLRFSPEATASRPKFVYIPFGAGPRQCIGNEFALIEAQLILATLAGRYRVCVDPHHPVEPHALISLRPRFGIRATLQQRSP